MDGVLEVGETGRFQAGLIYLAKRQYRLPRDVAEDLVQAALVTYLEVRHRYPRSEEHLRILVGIFRNKCREHIGRSVRAARGLDALKSNALGGGGAQSAARMEPTLEDGVLHELVSREDGRLILQALARLRPQAREMFRLITEEGLDRKQLMTRFGLNANTLDSRLHTYRRELRGILDRQGFAV
jgi:RNA polymerase sigma factor (sigma-70 family)